MTASANLVAMGKDDDDREAILSRRKRFVALALGGIAAGAMGCSDSHPEPMPCLDIAIEDTGTLPPDAGSDAGNDAGPTPCLEPPFDASVRDAAPTPCLDIASANCSADGKVNRKGDGRTDNSPCRSRKSAPGICPAS